MQDIEEAAKRFDVNFCRLDRCGKSVCVPDCVVRPYSLLFDIDKSTPAPQPEQQEFNDENEPDGGNCHTSAMPVRRLKASWALPDANFKSPSLRGKGLRVLLYNGVAWPTLTCKEGQADLSHCQADQTMACPATHPTNLSGEDDPEFIINDGLGDEPPAEPIPTERPQLHISPGTTSQPVSREERNGTSPNRITRDEDIGPPGTVVAIGVTEVGIEGAASAAAADHIAALVSAVVVILTHLAMTTDAPVGSAGGCHAAKDIPSSTFRKKITPAWI
ncbi:hypothetical protein CDD83_6272 [Cordyceps sp. RAO-2017]|nr:hypothetical protein CDD83_6272 [Cordyceps sp. RAO-2017]